MTRHERTRLSLDGLSVGDAFGECFFHFENDELLRRLLERDAPPAPWRWTDDTEMALSVVEELEDNDTITQDRLALRFATRMDPTRGYGEGAFKVLHGIKCGGDWRKLSRSGFGGAGSFGNGAAMRVAPLGAYLADRPLETVVEAARLSAEITHAHPEGIAGAIAVAAATALAWQSRGDRPPLGTDWLRAVRGVVPQGFTHDEIGKAIRLGQQTRIVDAALTLGNGSGVTARDTVPLCLWVCAWHSNSYEDALWVTVSALGDRDTTCAIVGGILAPRCGAEAIPASWLQAREPLSLA